MTANESYSELIRRSKELGVVNSCAAVLGWDQQTYMPSAGAGLRGEQMAFLASLAHQKFTDSKIGELLAAVEGGYLLSQTAHDPRLMQTSLNAAIDHIMSFAPNSSERASR